MTDSTTITPATEPLLLSAGAAAKLCGVSMRTWWSWQSAGYIPTPVLRRGRVIRWSRSELAAWIAADCPPLDRWRVMRGGRP